ncbi:MAG: sigma 54-interacting transcriptional regulator [Anaerovoracaceae bacterium]|nr:sigma 54-interacting transcriptional regulator [Anaerovoracaceae bacterium]
MINLLNKFNEDWINFFEVSYDGIIVADKNGRIVYMNPAAEKLEEVNKSQIIGKLASDLEKEGIYEKSVTVMVLKEKRAVSVKQCKGDKQLIITGVPLFEDNAIKWIYINERDATELNKIKQEIERYKKQLNVLKANSNEYISESPIMKKTLSLLERIAPTDISVLISGESGVGKDVCAKWIHNHSMRKGKPFMKIDCGALSETLLESELFGYEGGAFTGASNKGKKGLAEVADGGTLFLDEIGELPISLQTKLLRLVQENVFLPVGGIKEKHVDIRIIAATNKNLEDMIENSTFRQDLYYRLSVFPIKIPPLRESDMLPPR